MSDDGSSYSSSRIGVSGLTHATGENRRAGLAGMTRASPAPRAPVAARNGRPHRRRAVAGGGVVYRRGPHGLQVVLVGRPSEGLWALPKGTPEPGEDIEQTALREVCEETGIETAIVGRLGPVRYTFMDGEGVPVNKRVEYFLMRPVAGHSGVHDHEHEVVRWFDLHEAARLLTFKNQARILHMAEELAARIGS